MKDAAMDLLCRLSAASYRLWWGLHSVTTDPTLYEKAEEYLADMGLRIEALDMLWEELVAELAKEGE